MLYRKLSKPNRSVVQILTQQTMQTSCIWFSKGDRCGSCVRQDFTSIRCDIGCAISPLLTKPNRSVLFIWPVLWQMQLLKLIFSVFIDMVVSGLTGSHMWLSRWSSMILLWLRQTFSALLCGSCF